MERAVRSVMRSKAAHALTSSKHEGLLAELTKAEPDMLVVSELCRRARLSWPDSLQGDRGVVGVEIAAMNEALAELEAAAKGGYETAFDRARFAYLFARERLAAISMMRR